ncbi:alpha/beta hydrolase [Breznakiella homolactica]|uniref:Alpha/beta hydrolase n=1 Tax=Breznakiella homolactica TaxID=2798577 RepID=A0A7T8BA06_9SPIR|nr:alpha/beta hydrolase [Breznakiella homolactica]QQO10174.1 alpha/beta hydrolase [Breznakiella homolactica]
MYTNFQDSKNPRKRILKKAAAILILIFIAVAAGLALLSMSPRPAVMVMRFYLDRNSRRRADAQEKYVPGNIPVRRNIRYEPGCEDTILDVYFPPGAEAAGGAYPAVVWVHGGAWISGSKNTVSNYAKLFAARGYTVAAVGYSTAPEASYPTPVKQLNAALAFLTEFAEEFHIDPEFIVIAGDSAGAQIGAQFACILTNPAYAELLGISPLVRREQIAGMILHCGAYDFTLIEPGGFLAGMTRKVLWAYLGTRDFSSDPDFFAALSVTNHVTADFPPSLITAGNRDPLAVHSYVLADTLERQGAAVETLFFSGNQKPPAGHEYQFKLGTGAAQEALTASFAFLETLKRN